MGIGFFAPLPLAMMLPFMAGQSMIMGESFGKGFQYGKRKISSMSNEEFNKMNADQLGRELLTDYKQIIPHLEQAVRASSQFQQMIIQELIKIIPNFVDQLLGGGGEETGGKKFAPPPGVASFLTPIIPGNLGALNEAQETLAPPPTGRTYNVIETWALRWIRPPNSLNFTGASLAEIRYMMTARVKGDFFPEMKSLGASLIRAEKKAKDAIVTKTPTQAIAKTTTTGSVVQQIATSYAETKRLLLQWVQVRRIDPPNLTRHAAYLKRFLTQAKSYNRLVTLNRKPKLQIDTAKSMKAGRLIPK